MANSYLLFDFGGNEEAAQQARQRVEGWKQAFRLSKKMELKFERKAAEKDGEAPQLRLLVRLDFSDHERLSLHRWLKRIPSEAPFRGLPLEVVRHGDEAAAKTAALFDALD
jgi:hypothetical protein